MKATAIWLGLLLLACALAQTPRVGGTVVYAQTVEPDSLHPLKTGGGVFSINIMQHIAATLVTLEPSSGRYIPYLAESWTVSNDGRSYTFRLKRGVRFSDGSPLTARDWVYTFEQAKGPLNQGITAFMVGAVSKATAVDNYTLRLQLEKPLAPFLFNLTVATVTPISRAASQRLGKDYDRKPVLVGPYRVKEWTTARRVVLERNPDFKAGPIYAKGPAYVQTLEFRIITDPVVLQSAIGAGEIDVATVSSRDAVRYANHSRYRLFQTLGTAMSPYLSINNKTPAFGDVRVRQALNLAVNKDILIRLATSGNGRPQYGPLAKVDIGYSAGVESIGYRFDLEKAKTLMQEAGYTANADGILEKDGKPLKFVLKTDADSARVAEILQQQYRELGLDLSIQQNETGVQYTEVGEGKYDLALVGLGFGEADLLYEMFHSKGGINWAGASNSDLDKALEQSRTLLNSAERQKVLDQAQRIIVEQAYVVPLYSSTINYLVNRRLQDVTYRPFGDTAYSVLLLRAWVQ